MFGNKSLAKTTIAAPDYLATAQTGDVILWSSYGFEASLIKLVQGSFYSHVGVVLVLDTPLQDGDSGVYFYHSPSGPITGLVDHFSPTHKPKPNGGPQLNDLVTVLDLCRGAKSIEVRRLIIDAGVAHPWATGKLRADSKTIKFARSEHEKVYERNTGELIRSVYDGPGGLNVEDLSSYFCSELVAELYKRAGVLLTEAPSNEFTPADFSTLDPRAVKLAEGFHLAGEAKLTYPSRAHLTAPFRTNAGAGAAPPPPPPQELRTGTSERAEIATDWALLAARDASASVPVVEGAGARASAPSASRSANAGWATLAARDASASAHAHAQQPRSGAPYATTSGGGTFLRF